jgi:hypothetical protein
VRNISASSPWRSPNADQETRNPNVFYELAIRHATVKPVIQIIHRSEPIPFDVAGNWTIQFDHHDLDSSAGKSPQKSRESAAPMTHEPTFTHELGFSNPGGQEKGN